MNKETIYEILTKDISNSKIYIDEKMSKHTSFKIGGNADIFVKASDINDIKYILNFVKENGVPLTVIGNGSNMLVLDNGIRGITMQVLLDEINIDNLIVNVGAGVKLGMLAGILQKEGLSGFEFASRNTRYNWWSN